MTIKRTVLSILFVLITNITYSQVPSSCNVPAELLASYEEDVPFVAVQQLVEIGSPYADSIIIPQFYQDSIWEGLAAIYNATAIPETDSVFNRYCIHQHLGTPHEYPSTILIYVDTALSWTQAWQNLQLTTGYTQLDSLLVAYDFALVDFSSFFQQATLTTTQKINLGALSGVLVAFNGINAATALPVFGGGNRIKYTTNGGNREFDFYLGYGDCPSGCVVNYIWKFTVFPDCSVLYNGTQIIGSTVEPFPSPVNCNVTDAVGEYTDNKSIIYPNPNSGRFTVGIRLGSSFPVKAQVFDSRGQLVGTELLRHSGGWHYGNMNLLELGAGLYFIQFQSERGIVSRKVLVQ